LDIVRLDTTLILEAYTKGKQSYRQLAPQYNCSVKTIQRKIDSIRPVANKEFERVANVLMDTTYFGRKLGVMVFKDSIRGKYLYKELCKNSNQASISAVSVPSNTNR
jgi:hypothetical protein